MQIFMLPFIAVGLWLIVILIHRIIIPVAGVITPAVITQRETQSDEDGRSYHVDFTYTYNGVAYNGGCNVRQGIYDTIEIGSKAQVEILPIAPSYSPRLFTPPGNYQFESFGFLLFFTLFWNGVIGVFVWGLFVWPVMVKRIYEQGIPTIAMIVDKTTSSGEDSTSYIIKYEFTPVDIHGREGSVIKGQETIPEDEWKKFHIGDQGTILYLPNRPRMNVFYQYGGYRVVG